MNQPAHLMRWAGSKRRFADRLLAEFPERIESYCAPFGGSLADVFALIATGRFVPGAKVVVSDAPVVRDLYASVRNQPDELIDELQEYGETQTEKSAFAIAKNDHDGMPTPSSDVERAAALLVLNQLSYNGLYRVNRSGLFNAPRDKDRELDVASIAERVINAHAALNHVQLVVANDWRHALLHDCQVYYADPPYLGTYNGYSATPFSADDHAALAKTLLHLRRDRGSAVVASNSDCAETRELYPAQHWRHAHLSRANNITCDAATRGNAVTELLMVAR